MAGGLARGTGFEDVPARSGAAGDDPKRDGGGERALGIPTIRDRVVQAAAKIVLEPIFEADFEDTAYGYRPKRGAAAIIIRLGDPPILTLIAALLIQVVARYALPRS